MITLQADFNHMDARGGLRLADLRMHQDTPFAEIAAKHETMDGRRPKRIVSGSSTSRRLS
jgi:hypothetical protein